jgi:hypothetical protein
MQLRKITVVALIGVVFAGSLFSSRVASAWDGAVEGAIAILDVTGGSNYGFRITLFGGQSMCNGGPSWAYLNDTDSNYKTYAAALMMAKAQGSRVTVYSNLDGAYCHIGYISIQPN